jgi:hypothetical protein
MKTKPLISGFVFYNQFLAQPFFSSRPIEIKNALIAKNAIRTSIEFIAICP